MTSTETLVRKIRVLHIVQSLETGGLENGVVNLVNGSNRKDFHVDILCLRGKGELAGRVTNPDSKIFANEKPLHSFLHAVKMVRHHCIKGKYDILHSHGWLTMLVTYIGQLLTNSPKIINGEHGTMYFDTFIRRVLQKFLFSRMDLNLAVSAALKTEVIQNFNVVKDNFKPIINGVDIDKFHPSEDQYLKKRQELNIPKESFVVGSVGRLVPVKNYSSLIRSFSLMSKGISDAYLILVGDGPERAKLAELSEKLNIEDKVILAGRSDDIHEFISTMNVFVLPSFSEGLSNTVLEAMSCGKPVIVTNVGGNPEIVRPNKTGIIIPVNDHQSLTENLSLLYNDRVLLSSMSEQTRQYVVDNLSLDRMVNNYEEAYKDVFGLERRINSHK